MTEPRYAKRIKKLPDVVRVVQKQSARHVIGRAYARSIRRKHTKAVVPGPLMQKLSLKAAARHAVAKYQRVAFGVAHVRKSQGAPVLQDQTLVIERG
jgi:hypothetical protein